MQAFWDASSVVHLYAPSQSSAKARELARAVQSVVWWGTVVEVASALARLTRMGELSPDAQRVVRKKMQSALARWPQILPSEDVLSCAIDQVDRYTLTAGDAV